MAARVRGRSGRLFLLAASASLLIPLILFSGCARVLEPKGPAAADIALLWWVMFAGAIVIFLVVVIALTWALFRRRRAGGAEDARQGMRFVIFGGIVFPIVLLVPLMYFTVQVLQRVVDPPEATVLTVEVTSHDWWWEVRYPELGFSSANEINLPAGRSVEILLTSGSVIHSFCVPELQGKTDHMPGRWTETWLQADEPGVFRGQCAEFCGLQHAHMAFLVNALEAEEFDAWAEGVSSPPPVPTEGEAFRGLQVFLGSECASCHSVQGTDATGQVGPDLTDLASRLELGAGTVPNTRGNLAAWILNSQTLKPGNLMPPIDLGGTDLGALLTYLETLE